MESLSISHQTLHQFINAPFGIPQEMKNLRYEDRYQNFKKSNKIQVESTIEFEKNYFVHLKVPSESQKGLTYYDVVLQFFTPNEKIAKEITVQNYYVQFFSNSPGFVYKYASLYKLQGYLIESLYDKFDPGMINALPDKANSSYDLYFDSSIYYACRYILDNKITILGKFNIKVFKTKPVDAFFRDIQDTESLAITRDISSLEISLKKEIDRDTKLSHNQEAKLKNSDNGIYTKQIQKKRKKEAVKSTLKSSNTGAIKHISRKVKKTAGKSTFKK